MEEEIEMKKNHVRVRLCEFECEDFCVENSVYVHRSMYSCKMNSRMHA